MKFLVLSVCVAGAAALPSFYGLVAHPNGAVVPVDEPAVAAARAQHLDLLAAAHGHHAAPLHHAGPALAHHAVPVVAHHGYTGPLNLNTQLVGHPNGAVVPLDEPAVAAARADHFAAGGGHADHAYVAHAPVAAYHAAPVAAHHGYAAVAHHAAPAVVAHHVAPVVAHHGYVGPLNLNTQLVAHPNGAVVPVDEPAVAAARADHFAAGGGHADHAYVAHAPVAAYHAAPVAAHHGYAAVAQHAAPVAHYGLVAHPNGAVVPVDEPAVAAARAAHFAAGGGHHY